MFQLSKISKLNLLATYFVSFLHLKVGSFLGHPVYFLFLNQSINLGKYYDIVSAWGSLLPRDHFYDPC